MAVWASAAVGSSGNGESVTTVSTGAWPAGRPRGRAAGQPRLRDQRTPCGCLPARCLRRPTGRGWHRNGRSRAPSWRSALVDQAPDTGIVAVSARSGTKPLRRIGLQKAQRQAGTEQLGLQARLFGRVRGTTRLGRDAGHFGQRLRGVEVVVEGRFDRGRNHRAGLDRGQFAQGAVQAVQRTHRLFDQRIGPVQWLTVVGRQQGQAQCLRRMLANRSCTRSMLPSDLLILAPPKLSMPLCSQ